MGSPLTERYHLLSFARMNTACTLALSGLMITGCNDHVPGSSLGTARNDTLRPTAQLESPQPAQGPDTGDAAPGFPASDSLQGAALSYRIINAPNGSFGYDILNGNRLFVHQTNLPGMPGNEGCRTKVDAEKLAAFVIDKIRKGEMPPTVTPEELKTLGLKP